MIKKEQLTNINTLENKMTKKMKKLSKENRSDQINSEPKSILKLKKIQ